MRNAKLIVPVIIVLAVAALIGALAARSMRDEPQAGRRQDQDGLGEDICSSTAAA